VEEDMRGIGLQKDEILDQARWRYGMKLIHGREEVNLATPI